MGYTVPTIWLGAGKTTTFNMLTGDIRPSSGTAIVAGYDIVSDIRKVQISTSLYPTHYVSTTFTTQVQQHIGYCPQVLLLPIVYVVSCVLCSLML